MGPADPRNKLNSSKSWPPYQPNQYIVAMETNFFYTVSESQKAKKEKKTKQNIVGIGGIPRN